MWKQVKILVQIIIFKPHRVPIIQNRWECENNFDKNKTDSGITFHHTETHWGSRNHVVCFNITKHETKPK